MGQSSDEPENNPADAETLSEISTGRARATNDAGVRFGRYVVIGRLGDREHRRAYVAIAFDPVLDRRVVIKAYPMPTEKEQYALMREARTLAKLALPGVVAVFDAAIEAGQAYLAMELVEGTPLTHWVHGKTGDEVVAAFAAVATNLGALHRSGLAHGDIKPDNVICTPGGSFKLVDLELARGRGEQHGPAGGTPGFMAPEQLAGAPPSPPADQFAFATSLLWSLHVAAGARDLHLRTIDPSELTTGLTRRQRRALARARQGDPQARWPSIDALAAELGRPEPRARWAAAVSVGIPAFVVGWLAHALFT